MIEWVLTVLSHHVSEVNLRHIFFNRSAPLGRSVTLFLCNLYTFYVVWSCDMRSHGARAYAIPNETLFSLIMSAIQRYPPDRPKRGSAYRRASQVCNTLWNAARPHLKAITVKIPPTASTY